MHRLRDGEWGGRFRDGEQIDKSRKGVLVLLYAPSHRQDNTYHGLCYTSRGVYFIDACMYL